MRLRFQEGNGRRDPQSAREIATRIEQRPVPDHPESGLRIPSMDSGEGGDRQVRRFLLEESSDGDNTGAAVAGEALLNKPQSTPQGLQ